MGFQNIIVSSFQEDLIETVYKINEKIPLGVHTDTNLNAAIAVATAVKAVAIYPEYTMLTHEIVEELQENFKVFTYTVNNLKPIARIQSYNVDGIISDFPDRL